MDQEAKRSTVHSGGGYGGFLWWKKERVHPHYRSKSGQGEGYHFLLDGLQFLWRKLGFFRKHLEVLGWLTRKLVGLEAEIFPVLKYYLISFRHLLE